MKSELLLAALLGAAITGCASQTGAVSHDLNTHSHESEAKTGTASVSPDRPDERLASGITEARVNGLSCPLCAESLNSVMRRVDGVESVKLDLDQGIVRISVGKARPTRQEVAQAIDDAGFTFVSFVE